MSTSLKVVWLKVILVGIIASLAGAGCSKANIVTGYPPETGRQEHAALSGDRCLGKYILTVENGRPEFDRARQAQKDYDATSHISVNNPNAPVYLGVTSASWEDDPLETDPAQGTWHFELELRNNTALNIRDPWLIFIDLGSKEYLNPHGITSRAYIDPLDTKPASKPYVGFGDTEGLLNAHGIGNAECELFMPKEAGGKFKPIIFAAYGSFPDDYIDVGEGSADSTLWREAFDQAGGRGIVGSATEKVAPYGEGYIQYFENGTLIHNPSAGKCFYFPQDLTEEYLSLDNPVGTWGLPVESTIDAWMSSAGTTFDLHVFTEGGEIYRHKTGAHTGELYGAGNELLSCWEANGKWAGDLGLPVSDSYLISGGIAQDFEVCTIDYTGTCDVVDCGKEMDFRYPVNFPTANGYYKSQEWMTYKPAYGYHLGDDWDKVGGSNDDYGLPFYATEAGEVVVAQLIGGIWGKVIIIRHDNVPDVGTILSVYAHCKDISVIAGEQVEAGEAIGTIGNAEGLLQPHLHFEIRIGTNVTMNKSHSPDQVDSGPEGQVNPTEFVTNH